MSMREMLAYAVDACMPNPRTNRPPAMTSSHGQRIAAVTCDRSSAFSSSSRACTGGRLRRHERRRAREVGHHLARNALHLAHGVGVRQEPEIEVADHFLDT